MAMAYAIARADFSDDSLLGFALRWHHTDPVIAWQYREAWAIRCVEGKEVDVGEDTDNQT